MLLPTLWPSSTRGDCADQLRPIMWSLEVPPPHPRRSPHHVEPGGPPVTWMVEPGGPSLKVPPPDAPAAPPSCGLGLSCGSLYYYHVSWTCTWRIFIHRHFYSFIQAPHEVTAPTSCGPSCGAWRWPPAVDSPCARRNTNWVRESTTQLCTQAHADAISTCSRLQHAIATASSPYSKILPCRPPPTPGPVFHTNHYANLFVKQRVDFWGHGTGLILTPQKRPHRFSQTHFRREMTHTTTMFHSTHQTRMRSLSRTNMFDVGRLMKTRSSEVSV